MCDEADGGLLVWHICPSIIYAAECRGGGGKYLDGPAGDGSAGSSSGRDRAAFSLGDAATHIFFRWHNTHSPFFSTRHSVGALRSRAGHRTPLDRLSLYCRLPTDISRTIHPGIPQRISLGAGRR